MNNFLNYALLAQFTALAFWHGSLGNSGQAIYWLGAIVCTVGVMLK